MTKIKFKILSVTNRYQIASVGNQHVQDLTWEIIKIGAHCSECIEKSKKYLTVLLQQLSSKQAARIGAPNRM